MIGSIAIVTCLFSAAFWTGLSAEPLAAKPAQLVSVAGENAGSTGPAAQTWLWIVEQQRRLMGEMSAAVQRIKTDDPTAATIVLAVVSFVYGVIHAAGPGHGKFVVSSYALANARTLRRGVFLAFLSAMFQAVSAIVLVGVLAAFFYASRLQAKATAEAWLETASWGLIAAFGAWLLFRQLKPYFGAHQASHHVAAAQAGAGHGHGHHAHDGHHHHGPHHHHHEGAHGPDSEPCQDHAHLPQPRELEAGWSWRRALALAVSIGIRPCTGAIVVLFVAVNTGLWWAGVIATFAMALGTAITVSTLAIAAVWSRELALRFAGTGSQWGGRIERFAGLAGAALVLLLGTAGFVASLASTGPL